MHRASVTRNKRTELEEAELSRALHSCQRNLERLPVGCSWELSGFPLGKSSERLDMVPGGKIEQRGWERLRKG
jgi:hypothetical protein